MGNNVIDVTLVPSWLDPTTRALVEDTVETLIRRHSRLLIAIVLFGSVARHEERSTDDPSPSDVDLLTIIDLNELTLETRLTIFDAVGDACRRHLDAPREVNVMLATRTMDTWDLMFVESVARDGIVLYQRGPLPARLAEQRIAMHG